MSSPFCYGIDLGTTNSCMAAFSNERVETIENKSGLRITPSVVSFEEGNVKIGKEAWKQMELGKSNVFYSIKRLIGRHFNDPVVQDDLKYYNFNVESDEKGRPVLCLDEPKFGKKKLFPEQISALVLSELLSDACIKLSDVRSTLKAVITVPANFNDYQRRATIEAGRLAGFEVLDVLSEPTAAAICYAYNTETRGNKENVLVFDFGGGTLDVSILEIDNFNFLVKSTSGDTHCGGADIDNKIIADMVEKIKAKTGVDFRAPENREHFNKLNSIAVDIKEALTASPTQKKSIYIPGKKNLFEYSINTATLQHLCEDIVPRIENVMKKALDAASMKKENIDVIVMVGGSSSIPFIRDTVKNYLGKEPSSPIKALEGIALGAAIYGAHICRESNPTIKIKNIEKINVVDIIPMSIGFGTLNGVHFVIKKGSVRPYTSPMTRYVGKKGCDFFKIKVFEGEETDPSRCHLVSEDKITAKDFENGRPIVKLCLSVGKEEIRVIAQSSSGTEDLKIDTKKDAHSKEEVERMKKENELFLTPQEDEDEPSELLKSLISRSLVAIRKLFKEKSKKDEVKKLLDRYKKKCVEGMTKEECEDIVKEIEEVISKMGATFKFSSIQKK